ncbi:MULTISPECIES: SDR family oxidoreductase [unclassified Crossiella]|uniref:SDR family oxidoreductase n=1 Tax=unclassified Crossiella TaxID=2620835 RepID=UPI001FFF6216|nr:MULTISPECIES: SDR family oxidoreductase [unclassified Crossiella]MCK2236279.1 SDR family oxidoreductase [Crossiella sp. S99.2]MCK2249946.1 SDR family oxidoreductase [Crossiella sp. S99.1]
MQQVMIVTGASGGIGAATARLAAQRGFRVVLAARSAGPLEALAAELDGLAVPCDVAQWPQVRELVARTVHRFGRLDVVFANAGYSVSTSFRTEAGAPPEQWRDMVLTNVYGAALTAKAALPELLRANGHLVLTGSAAGRGIRPGNLYSATKWAVTGLAQNIRAECAGSGVRVSLLQPGLVDTGGIPPERAAEPKLTPEDVARAVLYAVEQPPHVNVDEIILRPA